ncbi:MAG: hypothetical protein ACRDTC_04385 [Pseudonocardiaceae bacterium]
MALRDFLIPPSALVVFDDVNAHHRDKEPTVPAPRRTDDQLGYDITDMSPKTASVTLPQPTPAE